MFSFIKNSTAEYKKVFYDFSIDSVNKESIKLSLYKNKTILLVNVASKCGFTKQYTHLQKLYDEYKDKYPEMIKSFNRYLKNRDENK